MATKWRATQQPTSTHAVEAEASGSSTIIWEISPVSVTAVTAMVAR